MSHIINIYLINPMCTLVGRYCTLKLRKNLRTLKSLKYKDAVQLKYDFQTQELHEMKESKKKLKNDNGYNW